jgi:PhzF family phenazine biosynthesis protein
MQKTEINENPEKQVVPQVQTVKIKQVDAFTSKPFTGNPAGVLTEAAFLSDDQMLAIANEMNLSETAFVLPSDKADFRIRWFTTEREVLFCGHATVAAMHALAEESKFGMDKDGDYSFTIEALVGLLPVKVRKFNGKISITLQAPEINLLEENIDLVELAAILEINLDDFNLDLPIMRDQTVDYIFLPVKNLKALNKVYYNYSRLKAFGEKLLVKGFSVFTTDTYDDGSHVHSRFFTPYYDVIEDPVTGSANAPLAVYLVKNNLVQGSLPLFIKAEQGDILRRRGRLEVRVFTDKGDENAEIEDGEQSQELGEIKAELIGEAVTVLLGEMFLA